MMSLAGTAGTAEIRSVRDCLKMLGQDAPAVAAEMVQLQAGGHGTVDVLIDHPVNTSDSSRAISRRSHGYRSVTVCADGTGPDQAVARPFRARHYPVVRRYRNWAAANHIRLPSARGADLGSRGFAVSAETHAGHPSPVCFSEVTH